MPLRYLPCRRMAASVLRPWVEFEWKRGGLGKIPELRHSVFALSRKYHLAPHGVAGRQRSTTYQDREISVITTYRWAEMQAHRIGYKQILHAIVNTDFPLRSPRIYDRVYFVKPGSQQHLAHA